MGKKEKKKKQSHFKNCSCVWRCSRSWWSTAVWRWSPFWTFSLDCFFSSRFQPFRIDYLALSMSDHRRQDRPTNSPCVLNSHSLFVTWRKLSTHIRTTTRQSRFFFFLFCYYYLFFSVDWRSASCTRNMFPRSLLQNNNETRFVFWLNSSSSSIKTRRNINK